jgi:pyruvate dehydrogenase E2 component (dihydrolipoamide acetyltransferase)
MAEFRMPSLGADMRAGTLVAWLKQPGDHVGRGDIIAEVNTDKGVIEVEVYNAGTVERLLVEPGTKVPVGTALATIREDAPAAEGRPVHEAEPAREGEVSREGAAAGGERRRISPLARRLAADLGVDLSTVVGTGPGGAITKEDVEARAGAAALPGAGVERVPVPAAGPRPPGAPPAGMRSAIAAAMSRSKREIPHYYLSNLIDLGAAMTWLAERNRERRPGERVLLAAVLMKAVARALRDFPELNGRYQNDRLQPSPAIHVGFAIALRQGGVVAPAVHDTDRKSIGEVMRHLRDLVNRARAGSLRSSELSDPTITVTALGERGVDAVYGVIFPPQVAIVGFGRTVERPWSAAGQIVSRPTVTATLSADHRVSDGHRGGLFLAAVSDLLQRPGEL